MLAQNPNDADEVARIRRCLDEQADIPGLDDTHLRELRAAAQALASDLRSLQREGPEIIAEAIELPRAEHRSFLTRVQEMILGRRGSSLDSMRAALKKQAARFPDLAAAESARKQLLLWLDHDPAACDRCLRGVCGAPVGQIQTLAVQVAAASGAAEAERARLAGLLLRHLEARATLALQKNEDGFHLLAKAYASRPHAPGGAGIGVVLSTDRAASAARDKVQADNGCDRFKREASIELFRSMGYALDPPAA